MKKVTKKELFNIMRENLEYSEYNHICISGMTLYYDNFEINTSFLKDDDFIIYFYKGSNLVGSYRSYETEYIYFDYIMYEII